LLPAGRRTEDPDPKEETPMTKSRDDQAPRTDLDASLERLGIRELEQRLEVAPLLLDAAAQGGDGVQSDDIAVCCACKIPYPGGDLPYPTDDPTGGVPTTTGPTYPGGIGI